MSKLNNLEGRIIGFLDVQKRLSNYRQENGRTRTRWLCLCLACGNACIKTGDSLVHSNSYSCGCVKNMKSAQRQTALKGKHKNNSRSKDLSGTIINDTIAVLERAQNKGVKTAWMCQCLICGTIFTARTNHLLRGLIRSCGCVKSFAERHIRKMLLDNNIKFETSYVFDDLVNPETGHVLYFDFAFLKEDNAVFALLEYQGEQHDENRENQEFGKQQRQITDKLKQRYCETHNIPLYQIWYYQNIDDAIMNLINNVLHVNSVPSLQNNDVNRDAV